MRLCLTLLAFGAALTAASPAKAQWFSDFFADSKASYHMNRAWPEPFPQMDRQAVALPIGLMVQNGWRKQCLLSNFHFEEGSDRLNYSGQQRVLYVLTRVPLSRRILYVQRTIDPTLTASRVAEVQQAAARISQGEPPQVAVTDAIDDGWPAANVQIIAAKKLQTMPDPVLPAPRGDGGSGGGSN